MSQPQRVRTRPVPALDGMRGIAVLAVLLFHGGVSWLQGGFLGVDLFFVLSGFLITALLLAEVDGSGTVDLRTFWLRRARRLLPALLVLVAVIVLVASVHTPLRLQPGVRASLLATLFYVANWQSVAAGGDYFTRTGPPSPVQHTWSLAIEEQFYLVWPLVVLVVAYLVLRRSRAGMMPRAIRVVALGGTAVSVVLMAVLADTRTGAYDRVYYGTDTRAQGLLVGAALATVLALRPQTAAAGQRRTRTRAAGLAAVVVLGWMITTTTGEDAWMYRGGFLLAAVAAAVVIWVATTDSGGPLARALSLRPLQALGRISYGVYLWHWPLFLALTAERTGSTGFGLLALRVAATVTVATVSYTLIEQPIRTGRVLVDGRRAARALLVSALVIASAGLLVVRPQGAISLTAQQLLGTEVRPTTLPTATPSTAPSAPSSPAKPTETLPARTPHAGATRLLVLGDSVAQTLFNAMPTYSTVQVTNRGVLGCGLLQNTPYRYVGVVTQVPDICRTWPAWWQNSVNEVDPDVVAVLVGRWEMMDRQIGGVWHHVGDPVFDRTVLADLERVLPLLTAHGARVALLTPPYYRRTEKPDGSLYPEDETSRVDAFTALLRQFAAAHPVKVSLVEFGRMVNPKPDTYSAYVDGVYARYDGVHITPQASAYLAPKLLPQLIALDPRTTRG